MATELANHLYPTARKEHHCIWCNQNIQLGEEYYRFKGRPLGEWQNWAMHLDCKKDGFEEWRKQTPMNEPIPYRAHKKGMNEYR